MSERLRKYVEAYTKALNGSGARGAKGRARRRVARQFGVTDQCVADALTDARKAGLMDGYRPHRDGKVAKPRAVGTPMRVRLEAIVRALEGSAYVI